MPRALTNLEYSGCLIAQVKPSVIIRPIQPTDLPKVEELIRSTILEVNSKDQSPAITAFTLKIDPFRPRDTGDERDYFVAEDGEIRGVLGLKDNELKTFFVDSKFQGQGIGTELIQYVEALIIKRGYSQSKVFSSITAKSFYEKHGYTVVQEDITKIGSDNLIRFYMEKTLL